MAYVETPRTDAGNATYVSESHNLENFSVEPSLLSPLKRKDDILSQMRTGRGLNLRTPRGARHPLAERQNLPTRPGRNEFTPLMRSVTKKNMERKAKGNGVPETPAFLKTNNLGSDTPALPGSENSAMYATELGSSMLGENNSTPIPQVTSSSAQSTPLAALPKRDAAGVLNDQGNLMTLREQENIIDKVEKENFGLKLKIHFLEESLRKAGPGFNEVALKENTDLKVDKMTITRDLAKCRKTLRDAERDIAEYRRQLEEAMEKAKRKHVDEKMRQEFDDLKSIVAAKDAEIEELRERLESAEGNHDDVEKLKGDIQDLEADVREKERLVDERDDEIDRVKSQAKQDADELDEVCAELEEEKKRADELEAKQRQGTDQTARLEEAEEQLQEALQAKEKAEEDLDELRDEMSNKSFTTKGLSRQLEEKANKLQDDLSELREKHADLQGQYDDKSRDVKHLQDELSSHDQDADVRDQRLKDQNELLRNQHEATSRKCESLKDQLQQAVKELQSKSEEKDLLHSRHDSLTTESQSLQKELSKSRAKVDELENSVEDERQHAQENDRRLRAEAKGEIDTLSEEIDRLSRELEDKASQHAADQDNWDSQKRSLQSQKDKTEEKAAGLQRTIAKLQETEGTLSGREMKMQEALESEKQRHENEEAVLERQVQEMKAEIDDKRQALNDLRTEISQTKEDLRVSQRDQAAFEEKVQALEDEIEVLQNGLEDEAEKAREELEVVEQEKDALQSQLSAAKEQLSHGQTDETVKEADQQCEALNDKLRDTNQLLETIKTEKRSLHDRLATNSIELNKTQTRCAEMEAERDEMQSQLKQMQSQVDDTFKLDQDKVELRKANLRMEADLGRLREERKSLLEQNAAIEQELEEEITKAASEEARLNDGISSLQRRLTGASDGRDRELAKARQKVQRLEARIEELESALDNKEQRDDITAELSMVNKDLSLARKKETELLQREASQKDAIRDLKQKVGRLERQAHEVEAARIAVDSPKSSVSGSARKSELVELQRQLADAYQQVKDVKAKSKDDLKALQKRSSDVENQLQANLDAYEQQREQFEVSLSAAQSEQQSLAAKNDSANQTIMRLRTRISSLEQDIRSRRQSTSADHTLAEERADLHEMLKDAKLQAEDLQIQVTSRESSIEKASNREKELRAQLKRVREERTLQTQKASALSTELDNLQSRHERAVDSLSRQQQSWEEERKAMASRVRFPNMSVSSLPANADNDKVEKRHASELRGLAKQIQWLRAKCQREEGFRWALVNEKKYLAMQIEMFEACNSVDLKLLAEMGVKADAPKTSARLRLGEALRSKAGQTSRQKPTLRTVGLMVMATCRMRHMAEDWAGQKKIREAIGRKLEGMVARKEVRRLSSGR